MTFLKWVTGIFKKTPNLHFIIIGLENSGKSTILKRLKGEDHIPGSAVPTIGYSTDSFVHGKLRIDCYDMSGLEKYRHLWEQCYKEIEAVIFVIDSDDRNKIPAVRNELSLFLEHEDIVNRDIPILFFANKMDIPTSMNTVEVSASLRLHEIENKSWNIANTNAITGDGVGEGINWLLDTLNKKKEQ